MSIFNNKNMYINRNKIIEVNLKWIENFILNLIYLFFI